MRCVTLYIFVTYLKLLSLSSSAIQLQRKKRQNHVSQMNTFMLNFNLKKKRSQFQVLAAVRCSGGCSQGC